MRDLKYNVARADLSCLEKIGPLKTERLQEIADAYIANMRRVDSLLTLPAASHLFSVLLSCSRIQAIQDIYGLIDPKFLIGSNADKVEAAKISIRQQEVILNWLGQGGPEFAGQEWMEFDLSMAIISTNSLMFPLIGNGIESAYSGAILASWTAFETLAGDFWEAAINASPAGLAELKGRQKRIAKRAGTSLEKTERSFGDSADTRESRTEGKRVSLDKMQELTKGSYNLSDKMGSLLKGGFSFITLTGIREAYSSAFDDHPDSIDDALSDKAIDALCIIRNLLVHKAGICDQLYIDEARSVPNAPRLSERERLQLDGEMVSNLIYPAVNDSVKLIKNVNSYIMRPGR